MGISTLMPADASLDGDLSGATLVAIQYARLMAAVSNPSAVAEGGIDGYREASRPARSVRRFHRQ
ncbi:MAG: hypothetical protein V3U14_13340, partial [candidate division NC10 bacterium]